MFKRIGTTLAAVAVVVALAGCGASAPEEAEVASVPGAQEYLEHVKKVWYGTLPSDADLVAYGEASCDLREDGVAIPDRAVLPGVTGESVSMQSSETDKNNWHIVRFAPAMCP